MNDAEELTKRIDNLEERGVELLKKTIDEIEERRGFRAGFVSLSHKLQRYQKHQEEIARCP
jgi:hypothetical protein